MYFPALAVCLGFATNVLAVPVAKAANDRKFANMDLPAPESWVATAAMNKRIIDVFTGDVGDYTDDTWQAYVLQKCQAKSQCSTTSIYQYSEISGDPSTRLWYGETFQGKAATQADFAHQDSLGITNSQVWTITGA